MFSANAAYVTLKSCLSTALAARNCRRTPASATSAESRNTITLGWRTKPSSLLRRSRLLLPQLQPSNLR